MAIPLYAKVCLATYLIPVSAGIAKFRSLRRSTRILLFLTVMACLEVAVAYFAGKIFGNNYLVTDLYRVVEITLLCAVFYYGSDAPRVKRLAAIGALLFFLYWIVDFLVLRSTVLMDTTAPVAADVLLIVIAAVALHAELTAQTGELFERPSFWVASAVILYSAGTIVPLGLGNVLESLGVEYFKAGWIVNWSLLILMNLFYARAMVCKRQA